MQLVSEHVSVVDAMRQVTYDADRVKIVRDDTSVDDYRANGDRSLQYFYRRHYPFDGDQTLATEHRVLFSLDEKGDYRLQGIIDRVVRSRDRAIEILLSRLINGSHAPLPDQVFDFQVGKLTHQLLCAGNGIRMVTRGG